MRPKQRSKPPIARCGTVANVLLTELDMQNFFMAKYTPQFHPLLLIRGFALLKVAKVRTAMRRSDAL
jgi:hypothetical protein